MVKNLWIKNSDELPFAIRKTFSNDETLVRYFVFKQAILVITSLGMYFFDKKKDKRMQKKEVSFIFAKHVLGFKINNNYDKKRKNNLTIFLTSKIESSDAENMISVNFKKSEKQKASDFISEIKKMVGRIQDEVRIDR